MVGQGTETACFEHHKAGDAKPLYTPSSPPPRSHTFRVFQAKGQSGTAHARAHALSQTNWTTTFSLHAFTWKATPQNGAASREGPMEWEASKPENVHSTPSSVQDVLD